MPFAPGDLLLVIAGTSISAAQLNPLLVMVATYAAVFAGAMCGRELFNRVGGRSVSMIARLLRVDDSVDRLAGRLRGWGSRGVFIGRVTPGLRVHTTEVSGLIAMPRLNFLKGMAPAVAAYEAAFVGLGLWIGPTAWETVHQHVPAAWKLVLVAALGLGLARLLQIHLSERRQFAHRLMIPSGSQTDVPGVQIENGGRQAGIEIRPLLRWALATVALAAICWSVLLAFALFGWTDADWIGKAILVWLYLVCGAGSAFLLTGWKNLSLIADATEIRFGKRSLVRAQVSEISTGPVAATATQFWLGVVVLALSQDITRKVHLRTADGRLLLETPDLYGSRQLARLATYLQIPFVDSYRRPARRATP